MVDPPTRFPVRASSSTEVNPTMPKRKQGGKASKAPRAVPALIESLNSLIQDETNWTEPALQTSLTRLHDLLTNLRSIQTASSYYLNLIPTRTESTLLAFTAHLETLGHSPTASPFRLAFLDPPHNATLISTRPIPKDTPFLQISAPLLLLPSPTLSPLLAALPPPASTPSQALALSLLLHSAAPSSPHKPYIATLPASFTIPFGTFTPAETLSLRPSPVTKSVINTTRAQLRNYTTIYATLTRLRLPFFPPALLSLDNYIWALSVVMTRQNALPGHGPSHRPPTIGLVPVWDLCNHAPGPQTTSVAVTEDGDCIVECRAMRDFEKGEPITMCYGERPNAQLFQFSGFVQKDNEHDFLPVELQMDAGDKLAPFKAKVVLRKAGVDVWEAGGVWVAGVRIDRGRESVARLLAVARVVVAGKDALNVMLKKGGGLPAEIVAGEEERKARTVVREHLERLVARYGQAEGRSELVEELHREECKLVEMALSVL